jgi:hypothetical protein
LWIVPVALGLMGCFGWGPYEPAAPLSSSVGLPYRLRATLADSSLVELTSPFVRADTLYGRSGPDRDTVALAVPTIHGLERERLSLWRTLGVVVAPAAALFAVGAIACGVGDCGAEPTY